jgi:hypothetical protein
MTIYDSATDIWGQDSWKKQMAQAIQNQQSYAICTGAATAIGAGGILGIGDVYTDMQAQINKMAAAIPGGLSDLTYELRMREAANGTLIEVRPVGAGPKPLAWLVPADQPLVDGLAAAIAAWKLQK